MGALACPSDTTQPPNGLHCELLEHPGKAIIHTACPRFGWVMRDLASDAYQTAYQLLVATTLDLLARNLGDIRDSGEVRQQLPHAKFAPKHHDGKPLAPHQTYWWKVRTWNDRSQISPWSQPQTFCTGDFVEGHATPAYPLDQHTIAPVEVAALDSNHTFVDFGRAAFGTIQLTLTSSRSTTIKVHFGEVRDGSHRIHRCPGEYRRYRMVELPVEAGTHTYRVRIPPDKMNTRAFRTNGQPMAILMPESVGEVMPFRYVEIVGTDRPLLACEILQIAVTYPFNDKAARFVSSDSTLNDIWELCHHTIKATSFCGLYVDGDRERIPYEADAYIAQMGHYCCDREFTLARRTHEYLIAHPTWPTEWILFSILIAWADYEYTGDASSLAHFYNDLKAKTLTALAREDALLSTVENSPSPEILAAVHFQSTWPLQDIVDWPVGERDGYEMVPVNTVVNAFYYRALVLMSRIASALDEQVDAREYKERAQRVRAAIQEKLIDYSSGLFTDGIGSAHSSLHANMFPLAFGLVPEKLRENILQHIKRKGMACSVYGAQFLLEGLYRARDAEHALSLLTSHSERSWAHMIYDVGTTMTLETWDNRFNPTQDWNHNWGAAPANIIPRFLMGIRPLTPGFGRILIEPQPADLAYAEAEVPTVRGPVKVRFNHRPGQSFDLDISLPANTSARVVLPRLRGKAATVLMDGKPLETTGTDDVAIIEHVGSGEHSFSLRA
jgi:alpha-L-rhamnosidase